MVENWLQKDLSRIVEEYQFGPMELKNMSVTIIEDFKNKLSKIFGLLNFNIPLDDFIHFLKNDFDNECKNEHNNILGKHPYLGYRHLKDDHSETHKYSSEFFYEYERTDNQFITVYKLHLSSDSEISICWNKLEQRVTEVSLGLSL
jgi:hypothetical protein